MKMHLASGDGNNTFTGYGDDYIEINKVRHAGSLIITPAVIEPWEPAGFESLQAGHFEQLLAFGPEVVLLGTGDRLRFPHPRLYQALTRIQVGVEVMDTSAVCRTFNILMSEGRRVVAAVLPR